MELVKKRSFNDRHPKDMMPSNWKLSNVEAHFIGMYMKHTSTTHYDRFDAKFQIVLFVIFLVLFKVV